MMPSSEAQGTILMKTPTETLSERLWKDIGSALKNGGLAALLERPWFGSPATSRAELLEDIENEIAHLETCLADTSLDEDDLAKTQSYIDQARGEGRWALAAVLERGLERQRKNQHDRRNAWREELAQLKMYAFILTQTPEVGTSKHGWER